jgi:3-oxoacyl-[acyl-carrier-protein] synthase-3
MQSAADGERPGSVSARIKAIRTFLPANILTNESLADPLENWTADKIFDKTGILQRHIASQDETALDLGYLAALRLIEEQSIETDSIDYLIFCSQAPDYILPTSACILQHRLGLPKSIGALDINLGCSGFVYGLSLATGLIAGGIAKRVLLITADTYSKFINDRDRSVRTLFGDGAAATLIEGAEEPGQSIGAFVFGTDGSGAKELIVESGGARLPRSEETAVEAKDASGNTRSKDNLYMNGGAVLSFTLREVPPLYEEVKELSGLTEEQVDFVLMHQANKFMLDALRKKMHLPLEKVPYFFETVGNTVSSTIPFVLEDLLNRKQIVHGKKVILLGFGVGLSWAGCTICF